MSDTVYAPSTAPGRAGVAVVRVSGPKAGDALTLLTGRDLPSPRVATLAALRDEAGETIDQALVLWFPAPASFTGEDVGEFHIHGGMAVRDAVLGALSALPGLRLAEPGEFTRRAVENGKMDLTQAEALADLIDAETESQRKQALRQYGGGLSALYEDWRRRLIASAAWIEATIDFADEDIPEGALANARKEIARILEEIQIHLNDSRRGEIVRNGVHLTLFGLVNTGKSSLLNALARRDVAIVSSTPGTTRDIIEVHLDLGGYAVIVSDTAGLREIGEAVEAEGVRRAKDRLESADVAVLVLDSASSEPFAGLPPDALSRADLIVWNKTDLVPAGHRAEQRDAILVSATTGQGLSSLLDSIAKVIKQHLDTNGNSVPLTRARHRQALERAAAALNRVVAACESDLMAEDVRLALHSLGRITGRVDVEELLDVVFRDFCIGK